MAGVPFLERVPPPAHLALTLSFANNIRGATYGGKATANIDVARRWRLRAGYALLQMRLHPTTTGQGDSTWAEERESPRHQGSIWSYLDLGTLAWQPNARLELSPAAQNLGGKRHSEFNPRNDAGYQSDEFGRSLVARIVWRF